MAINMGSALGGATSNKGVSEPAILNLSKNDVLDLTKREPGLNLVTVGAGWDVADFGQEFDLDIAAFMLGANGKVINPAEDVIYFNNKTAPGIQLMGDNRTGAGDGDDEEIRLNLKLIPSHIQKIVFCITIFEGAERRQTFGRVQNSYVRLLNAERNNREICNFNLRGDYSTATAVIFSELYRDGSEWQFKAIGDAKVADLNGLLRLYM